MNVSLYPEAATNINGVFQPLDAAHPNLLTSWTSISPNSAKIAAHSNLVVTVTIKVPANAPNVQQFGLIWASIKTSPNSNAVGGISRVGIRMYDAVGNAPDATPGATSSSTSSHGNSSTVVEFVGIGLVFLLAIAFGLLMVRKERKRAKKRRRKQRDSKSK